MPHQHPVPLLVEILPKREVIVVKKASVPFEMCAAGISCAADGRSYGLAAGGLGFGADLPGFAIWKEYEHVLWRSGP